MNTLSISQLRQNTADILNSVTSKQEPAIILQRSRPKAILVDIDYYQALEEAVFDLTDAKEAEKGKREEKEPFEKYLLKRFGKSSL